MTTMHDKEAPVSPQPFRIIRNPGSPRRIPTSAEPAPAACPRCGVYVADADVHAAHHDRTDEWVKRVNAVLNDTMSLLLTREGIPTTGGVIASGGKCADQTTPAIEGDNQ
ncbi:hypothetical protein [Nocardia sp. NPDC019255]|uniref:hypothetical protein n=1 Tax=Nocardia sp. NPDC019255 TaxID=3154591 RepID=UPI0033C4CC1C